MNLNSILKLLISPIMLAAGFLVRNYLYKFQHTAYTLTFQKDIEDWQPEVVHCNDWQTLSLGVLSKKNCNARLIFDSHELETHRNPPLPEKRKKWMESYERELFKSCDLITTVCEPISDFLTNAYDIKRPSVIYNSPVLIDGNNGLPRWGRIPKDSDVRSESGCDKSVFLIVSVGNVTVNRGYETILETMPGLPKNIHLAIVGKFSHNFDTVLFGLIEKYQLSDRVHIISPVNPNCVVNFIRSANVGLISLVPLTLSYDFALPNKLFECAFAGLTLIASDTQEIKKKVTQYKLGYLYEAGNAESLKESILKNFVNWQKNGQKNEPNNQFLKEHDFEKSAQTVLDFINQIEKIDTV